MMSSQNNISKEQIRHLMAAALENRSDDAEPVDDEQIALLASGRFETLPVQQRQALLQQVVADPAASELLADISRLDLAEKTPARRTIRGFGFMSSAWALAACLMVGLFIWNIADPAPKIPPGDNTISVYGNDPQPDYWDQLNKMRMHKQTRQYYYRDLALVISTSTCAVLSIVIVLLMIIARKKVFPSETKGDL